MPRKRRSLLDLFKKPGKSKTSKKESKSVLKVVFHGSLDEVNERLREFNARYKIPSDANKDTVIARLLEYHDAPYDRIVEDMKLAIQKEIQTYKDVTPSELDSTLDAIVKFKEQQLESKKQELETAVQRKAGVELAFNEWAGLQMRKQELIRPKEKSKKKRNIVHKDNLTKRNKWYKNHEKALQKKEEASLDDYINFTRRISLGTHDQYDKQIKLNSSHFEEPSTTAPNDIYTHFEEPSTTAPNETHTPLINAPGFVLRLDEHEYDEDFLKGVDEAQRRNSQSEAPSQKSAKKDNSDLIQQRIDQGLPELPPTPGHLVGYENKSKESTKESLERYAKDTGMPDLPSTPKSKSNSLSEVDADPSKERSRKPKLK